MAKLTQNTNDSRIKIIWGKKIVRLEPPRRNCGVCRVVDRADGKKKQAGSNHLAIRKRNNKKEQLQNMIWWWRVCWGDRPDPRLHWSLKCLVLEKWQISQRLRLLLQPEQLPNWWQCKISIESISLLHSELLSKVFLFGHLIVSGPCKHVYCILCVWKLVCHQKL